MLSKPKIAIGIDKIGNVFAIEDLTSGQDLTMFDSSTESNGPNGKSNKAE